jgi:hypothetical protein
MLSKKQIEELKKNAKRRANRPVPQVQPASKLKASASAERRMARDHLDLLQNVDFTLLDAHRRMNEVDDQVVATVLQAAIRRSEPQDPLAVQLLDELNQARALREDASDDLWTEALQVVYSSVRRHSSCRGGDTAYLNFVARYIP